MTERKSVEELYPGTRPLSEARTGDDLGSFPFTLTEEMAERNAWANDDYNPWYMDDSPFGGRIASPVLLASFDAKLFYGYYAYPAGGSLFAKQEFEYIAPLLLGVEYTLAGVLSDVYERKGRTFYRVEETVTDADGAVVLRTWKTVASPVNPEVPAREEQR